MVKNGKGKRFLALGLTTALVLTSAMVSDVKAEAASAKKVKSVTLKINKKKVNKKTFTLAKGNKAKITVTVNPKKAKKSVSFKSSKPKVASVSKKGKVTAKKNGTAKITVTVKGKNGKKKKAWVKIKVGAADVPSTDPTAAPSTQPSAAPSTQPSTAPSTQPSAAPSTQPSAAPSADPTATPEPTPEPTPKPTPNYNNTPFEYSIDNNPIGTMDENGNPLYGGDPAILVDGDTVYLYTGHDVASASGYVIPEYLCYSTKDLKNWTCHGVVLSMKDVDWGDDNAAWAGQVMKHDNKYYLYYCSWDKTSSGKQSIGVAVADKATGPFIDIGKPLVKGTVTTGQTSDWNDIDPTAWIETDSEGVEHRYLAWGNGKFFVCELNEDMISVKDLNGDGKITFGTQASGKTSANVDIIEKDVTDLLPYTEAPWLYRRQDEDGNYYGKYYLFYAYKFTEEMAYATTDDLLNGRLEFGSVLMEPSTTSNTNHMAVFDFKGKTYFVYHNGQLPAGTGFRRSACITEVHFNEDGSIQPIPETAAGIWGTTTTLYTSSQDKIAHEHFRNSNVEADYPYINVAVGAIVNDNEADSQWVMTKPYYGEKGDDYVCIQSENKPGLYLTGGDDNTVVLAQNAEPATIEETAKKQTFKKITGLNDEAGVSFESVAYPGKYITCVKEKLYLTDGDHKAASTFYIDEAPAEKKEDAGFSSENSLKAITNDNYEVTKTENDYSISVPYTEKTVSIKFETTADDGYVMVNGGLYKSGETAEFTTDAGTMEVVVWAPDYSIKESCNLTIKKDFSGFEFGTGPVKTFNFEDTTDGAVAVTKGLSPAEVEKTYAYVDGVNDGKALSLDGTYGMKLCETAELGDTYSISFWMNPTTLGGGVDPIFAAGTFTPECWINITAADRGIWCKKDGGYVDLENLPTKKYETGKWQHVTVTVTSNNGESTGKLYLNGALIASGKVADGVMTTQNAVAYFGVNGWDAYFNGAVDEIMLFDRALTDDEAFALSEKVETAASLASK